LNVDAIGSGHQRPHEAVRRTCRPTAFLSRAFNPSAKLLTGVQL